MIEAQGITRRYGDFAAVNDVSFSVNEGEIVGILGPNGAGKTTTIRMITGFLPPSGGRVTLGGRDSVRRPPRRYDARSAICRRTWPSTPRCGSASICLPSALEGMAVAKRVKRWPRSSSAAC